MLGAIAALALVVGSISATVSVTENEQHMVGQPSPTVIEHPMAEDLNAYSE